MRARWSGTCPICDTDFGPGEQVKKLTGDWVHENCKWPTMVRVIEGEVTPPPVAITLRPKQYMHVRVGGVERTGDMHGLRPPKT